MKNSSFYKNHFYNSTLYAGNRFHNYTSHDESTTFVNDHSSQRQMKLKNSALVKSLNKKNQPNQNRAGSNPAPSKPTVHHTSKKKDQQTKHQSKSQTKASTNAFQEQTQELLERNFKQMKSLQKAENPITVSEATFTFTPTLLLPSEQATQAQSRVLEELDNMIQKDSDIRRSMITSSSQTPVTINQHQTVIAVTSSNKFDVLAEDEMIDDEESTMKRAAFSLQPASFQLPERRTQVFDQTPSMNHFSSSPASFSLPTLPSMAIPLEEPLGDDVDPDL